MQKKKVPVYGYQGKLYVQDPKGELLLTQKDYCTRGFLPFGNKAGPESVRLRGLDGEAVCRSKRENKTFTVKDERVARCGLHRAWGDSVLVSEPEKKRKWSFRGVPDDARIWRETREFKAEIVKVEEAGRTHYLVGNAGSETYELVAYTLDGARSKLATLKARRNTVEVVE